MAKSIIKQLAEEAINEDIYVPDMSILVEGLLLELVKEKKLKGTVIIHNAILNELEYGANRKKTTSIFGLDELAKTKELENGNLTLEFYGDKTAFSRFPLLSNVKKSSTSHS
jgi:predicted PilT family ATPase